LRGNEAPAHPSTKEAAERIEDHFVRHQVKDLVRESAVALVGMMALKSIFVAPIAFVVCIISLCSTGLKFTLRDNSVVNSLSETIQDEAQFV
jgi:hypothetical protein